jgi:hypothetical protein
MLATSRLVPVAPSESELQSERNVHAEIIPEARLEAPKPHAQNLLSSRHPRTV